MTVELDLTERIKNFCKKIGVDIVGFADPKLFDRFPKNNQPEHFFEDAKTVIILGMHLYDIILDSWSVGKNNYQFIDSILENHCHKVKDFILNEGYNIKVISYAPGLFLKDSAALAGLGPIGKNNLLITERFGSQIRLRALITDAHLKHGDPILESKYCINCNKCIEACPAQALTEGRYNRDACYPYNLSHLRKLSNYSSIWCNICIEACPIGKKSFIS